MKEILPGLFQFRIPIPNNPILEYTNSYLLQGDGEALLIDPGMNNPESFKALKNELKESGVSVKTITRIIATHAHPDHYGLAGKVKKLSPGAQIIVHKTAGERIKQMAEPGRGQGRKLEQWLKLNGVPRPDPAEVQKEHGNEPVTRQLQRRPRFTRPVPPDVLLEGDETIEFGEYHLKVIFTPGHDPGHICLYEQGKKILFAGDHVLPVTTPSIGLQSEPGSNPLGDFLNSTNAIKDLDVDLVLPAHEHPFINFKDRVDEIITHHRQRAEEILACLKEKPKTAYKISQDVIWMPKQGGVKFQSLNQWARRMAVMSVLAHLKVMQENGKVGLFSKNEIIYYNVTDNDKISER
jgi:glyoxylase-like metal-dependent hydrolase (beta-lactamase superfamily II)